MTLPNFLIIGAAKSGTTALHHYLAQHPQIYTSPLKEAKFFAFENQQVSWKGPGDLDEKLLPITNLDDYRQLFSAVANEIAIGESSPYYLYSPEAPERIQNYIPEVKLIAILRNPIDRAYSSFLHMMRDGREPIKNFAAALREEEKRINDNWAFVWHYKNAGFYYTQLKRYFDRFNRGQIKVYLYDDFEYNPLKVMQDIFLFLGVDEVFTPDMSRKYNASIQPKNKAAVPKNKILHSILESSLVEYPLKTFMDSKSRKKLIFNLKNKNLKKQEISSQVRLDLINSFRDDTLNLQELIGQDLSAWLR
jgi:hypothetical protein